MTAPDKDIIDLTADLSEMGTPTPQLSSAAKKRSRRDSQPERFDRNEKRAKKHGLVGEPFALTGREMHYKAIHFKGMLIEVSRDGENYILDEGLMPGRCDDYFGLGVSSSYGRFPRSDDQSSRSSANC